MVNRFDIDRLHPRDLDKSILALAATARNQARFKPESFPGQDTLKHFYGWLLGLEAFVTTVVRGETLRNTDVLVTMIQVVDIALLAVGHGSMAEQRLDLAKQFWQYRFREPDRQKIRKTIRASYPRATPKATVNRAVEKAIKQSIKEHIRDAKNDFDERISEAERFLHERGDDWRTLTLVVALEALTTLITVATSDEREDLQAKPTALEKWHTNFLRRNVNGWRRAGLQRVVTVLFAAVFPPPIKDEPLDSLMSPTQQRALCRMLLRARDVEFNLESLIGMITIATAALKDFGEPGPLV